MKNAALQTIVLATGNPHKAEEIAQMLGGRFHVVSMGELGFTDDIVEDGVTIQENADIKANALANMLKAQGQSGYIVMADDTGLFVDALDGVPGVYSARYAGEDASYADNNTKLLNALKDVPEPKRGAHFETCLSVLMPDGERYNLTGCVPGRIAENYLGEGGFGYDPIFIEKTTGKSYAQMNAEEKNRCSHRRAAVERLLPLFTQG